MKTASIKISLLYFFVCVGCSSLPKEELVKVEKSKPGNVGESFDEIKLRHSHFEISYNKKHRLANWVKYTLKKEDLGGPGIRLRKFKPDPLLKKAKIVPVVHDDYTNSGFARGHLAPAEDFSRSQEAIESTFIMTNVIPQKGSVNSGSWSRLEKQVRSWACGEEEITVITGPLLKANLEKLPNTDISVPNEFFKFIVDETPPRKAIAFIYNQVDSGQTVFKNKVTIDSISEAFRNRDSSIQDSKIEDWKVCTK